MKKSILAVGLATALVTTSFAGSAMARPYRDFHHRHYYHHRHNDIGPAIIAGTIFGMIGAAIANSYHHPYYGYRNAHVRWCEDHYRTYNPATNMFYARPGVRAYCHSPYN